ncbi:hypothetical protein Tco_1540992 [Tanacetum coccineum]
MEHGEYRVGQCSEGGLGGGVGGLVFSESWFCYGEQVSGKVLITGGRIATRVGWTFGVLETRRVGRCGYILEVRSFVSTSCGVASEIEKEQVGGRVGSHDRESADRDRGFESALGDRLLTRAWLAYGGGAWDDMRLHVMERGVEGGWSGCASWVTGEGEIGEVSLWIEGSVQIGSHGCFLGIGGVVLGRVSSAIVICIGGLGWLVSHLGVCWMRAARAGLTEYFGGRGRGLLVDGGLLDEERGAVMAERCLGGMDGGLSFEWRFVVCAGVEEGWDSQDIVWEEGVSPVQFLGWAKEGGWVAFRCWGGSAGRSSGGGVSVSVGLLKEKVGVVDVEGRSIVSAGVESLCGGRVESVLCAWRFEEGAKSGAASVRVWDYRMKQFDVSGLSARETVTGGSSGGIDAIDGLDGTERGYQGLCLDEILFI